MNKGICFITVEQRSKARWRQTPGDQNIYGQINIVEKL